jgi:nitroreductase
MSYRQPSVTQGAAEQARLLAGNARYLIATAARAPSVHNSQPWRFRVDEDTVELWADPARKTRDDAIGREMLISCGAALFGLRLAVRSLGHLPVVDLLPDPSRLRLLARVRVAAGARGAEGARVIALNELERRMLAAVPHRHTHRGPFLAEPLPPGLLAGLQNDALTEGATLALVGDGLPADRLARLAAAATRQAGLEAGERAEIRRWTRGPQHPAADGVPAAALVAGPSEAAPGRLPQRDFDLGRDLGLLPGGGAPPAATAVLLTAGDRRADWLRAGQALQRLLLHAASEWVFASLYTQPLENSLTRELIRDQLRLPGDPQMLLQLGRAGSAASTPRRPPGELMDQLRVQPLQVLGHPVLVMAADDAGRGGEHGRVRVGDRAGDARPGEQRQVVRHVAERDDLRGADAAGGRELGDRAGLAHPGRGGLDEPLAVGVRDADQAVEHRHGQREQLVRAVAEVPGEQLGGRLAEQRAVTGAGDGRVGVPADRLVHAVGGPPVRALDCDPDAGDRGAQRPRRRRELLRLDQVPCGDGAGPHVVLDRPVGADRRPPLPERRRDVPHHPRRPPGDQREPCPRRLHPRERRHGARRDRPVAADNGPVQVASHQQRERVHNA